MKQPLVQIRSSRFKSLVVAGEANWLHRNLDKPENRIGGSVPLLSCCERLKETITLADRAVDARVGRLRIRIVYPGFRQDLIDLSVGHNTQYVSDPLDR